MGDAAAARSALAALEARSLELWRVRRALKDELVKPRYAASELARDVPALMDSMGLASRLRSEAYSLHAVRAARARAEEQCGGDVRQQKQAPQPSVRQLQNGRGGTDRKGGGECVAESHEDAAVPAHAAVAACRSAWHRMVAERINRLANEHAVPLSGKMGRGSDVPQSNGNPGDSSPSSLSSPPPHLAPLSMPTAPSERLAVREGGEAGQDAVPQPLIPACAYSWVELLDALEALEPPESGRAPANGGSGFAGKGAPSRSRGASRPHATPPPPQWGTVRLALRVPSHAVLAECMPELAPSMAQGGIDDSPGESSWFAERRSAEAAAVAAGGSAAASLVFARRGVPQSARPRVWAAALGILGARSDRNSAAYFEGLCESCERQDMMLDALVRADIAAVTDNSTFFVFEEQLRVVLLAFMRDASVACAAPGMVGASVLAHPRLQAMARDGTSRGLYPPCGVVPFIGLACYAAPLCYLYANRHDLYIAFRALYERHFCRLHTLAFEMEAPEAVAHSVTDGNNGSDSGMSSRIGKRYSGSSSSSNGAGLGGSNEHGEIASERQGDGRESVCPPLCLPALCKTFEDLLQELDSEVFYKLLMLGLPPLHIAMPWLVSAFATHLDAAETLQLWDRIIGFDSLLPLAMFAAAVIRFRREAVLAACSVDDVKDIFIDLKALRVAPLLQSVFLNPIPAR